MSVTKTIAVDLGASSGRLISGVFDGKKIVLKEQFRFSNQPINLNGSLYWDYFKIFQEIKYGLAIAQNDLGTIDSMGIDTWGVDYGLLDRYGKVLQAPHSYRDTRTLKYLKGFKKKVSETRLFYETGVKLDPIDTVVQLYADLQLHPELKNEIANVLMMPNLIGYFFTGKKENEYSILSTSGLLDGENRKIQVNLLSSLGMKDNWFAKIIQNGKVLGSVLPEIKQEIDLKSNLKVINGVAHDTAAAVNALPISSDTNCAFVSCGTWSIIGTLTKKPVINETALKLGLTNEGCFDGSNRVLQNITGLWIVQELQKEWSYQGKMIDWAEMVKLAEKAEANKTFIDPEDASFVTPGNMEEKIIAFAKKTAQPIPRSKSEMLRCVFQSLALTYEQTISNLEKATGKSINTLYMFGGGVKNKLLVQLVSDYSKRVIKTGPAEASVTGNIISQLEVLGKLNPNDRFSILRNSFASKTIEPQGSLNGVREDIISRFRKIRSRN